LYDCSPLLLVGDVVCITGLNLVDKADATVLGTRPVIGFCVNKPTATTAVVQMSGEVGVFAGALTPNQIYYLGHAPGSITNDLSTFVTGDTIQTVGVSKNTSVLTIRFETRMFQ
jgi:hypothetical protein